MYLLGYSLDNLSLMALTISTGFVVDDAIVVIENITRHLEQGMTPLEAALRGAARDRLHRLSMSISLIAVFIPILLMGGIVGRLFREFAVTLSVAIAVSLVVSLTTTPMMCARFLQPEASAQHGRLYRVSERAFDCAAGACYERSLGWVLRHPRADARSSRSATIGLNVYLYVIVPKGFFPQQDTGRLIGNIQARQDISFPAMQREAERVRRASSQTDPAVENVVAFTGGGRGSARTPAACSSRSSRSTSARSRADQVIDRLRAEARARPRRHALPPAGAGPPHRRPPEQRPVPVHAPGRRPRRAERLGAAAARASCATLPQLRDVNSDQQNRGLQATLVIDRDTAVAPRHHRRRRSTTRSTTPSASARSRPSTRRSTSTTSSWRSTRSSSRTPTRSSSIYVTSPTRRAGAAQRLRALRARRTRRSRSTTRASSRRSRSRSTWRPGVALGEAVARDRGSRARDRHARHRSTAASRAPRRPSRPRSPTSRC